LYDKDGKLVYCLVTCGLCNKGTLDVKAESVDIVEEYSKVDGNVAVGEGKAKSKNELTDIIKDDMTSAIVSLTTADLGTGADKEEKVTDAAIATTEVVSTAVATAYSSVELRGFTNSVNS